MPKKLNLKELLLNVSKEILKRKVIFFTSLYAFCVTCFVIFIKDDSITKKLLDVLYGALLGSLVSFPIFILTENMNHFKKYLTQFFLVLATVVLGCLAIKGFGNKAYGYLYYYGIFFASMAITILIFMPSKKETAYFANLVKNFFFSLLMATIIMAGFSLLTLAFTQLIYEVYGVEKIYEVCAAFSFILFFINAFSYQLFTHREDETSGKALKIICVYIILPIYFILMLVLYAYLIKALILREFPRGQINWFVSFASLSFIVFYFILSEHKEVVAVKFFYSFGSFALIPLIAVQLPAFFIRVNAYGFTGYRYSSLLFIIFSIIFVILTIVNHFYKKLKLEKISLSLLAAFILFDTLSPFNLIDVAYKSQLTRLENIMLKYNIFDGKKFLNYDVVALEKNISAEDRKQLLGAYQYICYKSSKKPEWFETRANSKKYNFTDFFGIKEYTGEKNLARISNVARISLDFTNTYIDISEFSTLIEVRWSFESVASIYFQDEDLTNFVLSIKKDSTSENYVPYIDLKNGKRFYCTSLYYEYNLETKTFSYCNIYGYLLTR